MKIIIKINNYEGEFKVMSVLEKKMNVTREMKQMRDDKLLKMNNTESFVKKAKCLIILGAFIAFNLLSANILIAKEDSNAKPQNWVKVAEMIEANYTKMLKSYKNGDNAMAMELAADNYFNIFDSEEYAMELIIDKNISEERAGKIEHYFHEIIKLIQEEKSFDELKKTVKECLVRTKRVAKELDKAGVKLP